MRLWLTRNSAISVKQQLVEQIAVGIASGDLQPGEKLPSTRELARRYGIHQNTVSTAYKHLTTRGLLNIRKGSGVFVAGTGSAIAGLMTLDGFVERILNEAAVLGFSADDIAGHIRAKNWSAPANRVVLIESDVQLREILEHEIKMETGIPVSTTSLEEFAPEDFNGNTIFAAMFDERGKLAQRIPSSGRSVFLQPASISESLAGRRRPTASELVAVISGWPRFLELARLYLVAAKLDPESIVLRSTGDPNWRKTAQGSSLVICDTLTASKLPQLTNVLPFVLLSLTSLKEIRQLAGFNPRE